MFCKDIIAYNTDFAVDCGAHLLAFLLSAVVKLLHNILLHSLGHFTTFFSSVFRITDSLQPEKKEDKKYIRTVPFPSVT